MTIYSFNTRPLAQQLWQGGTETELLRADVRAQFADLRADLNLPPARDPSSFVPAAVRAATRPVRQLGLKGGPLVPFVQVPYHGHTLYYRAAEDLLLWEHAPNAYQQVDRASQLAALANTPTRRLEQVPPPPPAVPYLSRELIRELVGSPEEMAARALAVQARDAAACAAFDEALWKGATPSKPGPS